MLSVVALRATIRSTERSKQANLALAKRQRCRRVCTSHLVTSEQCNAVLTKSVIFNVDGRGDRRSNYLKACKIESALKLRKQASLQA